MLSSPSPSPLLVVSLLLLAPPHSPGGPAKPCPKKEPMVGEHCEKPEKNRCTYPKEGKEGPPQTFHCKKASKHTERSTWHLASD